MPHCLITGASGFVGSNLTRRLLREGWQVSGLVRSDQQADALRGGGAAAVSGSLDDRASLRRACAGTDVVFHVAGRTRALRYAEYHRDNVEGTRALAQAAAAQSNPPVLVLVSSLAAGGPATCARPRTEADPEQPLSDYGRSKLDAERAAAEAADALPLSVVRPPIVFGPGDRAGLAMYRGMKVLPVHPTPGWRPLPISLVYVDDLCEALLAVACRGERRPAAATRDPQHRGEGVYYVTAERDVTYGEMGKLAAAAAGWAVVPVPLPRLAFRLAGLLGEAIGRWRGVPAVVNRDKAREALAPGWVASADKIRGHLGFAPAAPLEQRFATTVSWYCKEGWL
jgi:nucleoside-diphosphate-sugar epimerase